MTDVRPARNETHGPPTPPSGLASGEVIAGRFEVRRFLGQGGMGQVFEAFDRELGEPVALKVLLPEIAGEARAVAAFKREVQLARRVTHPNVCRIFDLFPHERDTPSGGAEKPRPLFFLTMELLRGETLSERLRRGGPLSVGEAVPLARQLAAALDAAHAAGVLHRDLKSGNVMLTDGDSRPRLVVTDFGLARPAGGRHEGFDGEHGGMSGTPAYMAPELFVGGETTSACDVYAFGVVLFEMITGQLPFGARPGLGRSDSELAAPSRLRTELHPAWDEAIRGCLRLEPGERFPSAGAAIAVLGAGEARAELETETLSGLGGRIATPPAARRRGPLLAVLGAVLLLALGIGTVAGWWQRAAPPAAFERERIVLGQFENRTGETLLDGTLESALRIALEQSRAVSVLSESQVQAVLTRMQRDPTSAVDRTVGAEIGVREGAVAVILGSVARVGSSYLVSATIVDPPTGDNLFSTSVIAAGQDQLLGAVAQVAREVRGGLGEPRRAIAATSAALEKVTTADLEALRLYSLAVRRLDNFQPEDAIAPLRRALELDPEFAMAHARLAAAFRMLGHPHGDVYRHLRRALELRERLTAFEQLYVESWIATLDAAPETMALWTLAHQRYPEEPVAVFNLAAAHFLYGLRFDLAVEVLSTIGEYPTDAREIAGLERLGFCLLALGRIEEALAVFERYRQVAVHPWAGSGYGMLAAGRAAEARELLAVGLAHPSPRRRFGVEIAFAALAADAGRLDEAFAAAERARRLAQTSALGATIAISADVARVAILVHPGASPEREAVLRDARATVHELLGDGEIPLGSYPVVELALLGKTLARAGRTSDAEEILAALGPRAERAAVASYKVYTALLEAELLAARGQRAEAVAVAERSLGLAETFQAHAALARWYLANGEVETARRHGDWLADRRGLAFGEVATEDALGVLNALDARALREALARVGE